MVKTKLRKPAALLRSFEGKARTTQQRRPCVMRLALLLAAGCAALLNLQCAVRGERGVRRMPLAALRLNPKKANGNARSCGALGPVPSHGRAWGGAAASTTRPS